MRAMIEAFVSYVLWLVVGVICAVVFLGFMSGQFIFMFKEKLMCLLPFCMLLVGCQTLEGTEPSAIDAIEAIPNYQPQPSYLPSNVNQDARRIGK